ncbi:hypothetical protein C2S52_015181 [Perilla frutescens var. hirtella]|nr:hypothetical protein C2S52_015181 [Perilla frutescens var. hirtella]
MSPASRSKSKDKKFVKEPPKSFLKPSSHASMSTGTPASGYNPVLGTFHTFETARVPSASPLHVNGRFRNIDDTDDHNENSTGAGIEYDSISNNGSWVFKVIGEQETQCGEATPFRTGLGKFVAVKHSSISRARSVLGDVDSTLIDAGTGMNFDA